MESTSRQKLECPAAFGAVLKTDAGLLGLAYLPTGQCWSVLKALDLYQCWTKDLESSWPILVRIPQSGQSCLWPIKSQQSPRSLGLVLPDQPDLWACRWIFKVQSSCPSRVLDLGPFTLGLGGCLPVANAGQCSEVGWGWPLEAGPALDLHFEAPSFSPLQLGNGQTQAKLPSTPTKLLFQNFKSYLKAKFISHFKILQGLSWKKTGKIFWSPKILCTS